MNRSSVNIDIEKRSALVLMPYLTAGGIVEDASISFFMGLGAIENLVVSSDGETFSVSMWYDYGSLIPDNIWEMFDRNSLIGMCGDDVSDQFTREAVLASVEQLYPKVAKAMEESSSSLIERWKNK